MQPSCCRVEQLVFFLRKLFGKLDPNILRSLFITLIVSGPNFGCQNDMSHEVREDTREESNQPVDHASKKDTPDNQKNSELIEKDISVSKSESETNVRPLPFSSCEGANEKLCAVGIKLLELINKERRKVGVSELTWSLELAYAAQDWSRQQGEEGKISHNGFPHQHELLLQKKFGDLEVQVLGENVGYTSIPLSLEQDSNYVANEFYKLWRDSPGHYRNMISSEFETIGMGFSRRGKNWYGTQIFGK